MTIGLGFHCKDGIVLAADQQNTVEGGYKVFSCKMGNIVYGRASVVWTFAYIPNLVTVMRDGLLAKLQSFPKTKITEAQVSMAIGKQIDEMRKKYPEEMAYQQFLFSFSCGRNPRLARVQGGIVDEPSEACIGCGDSSLVNFILESFRSVPIRFMWTSEAMHLAIYIVYLAKKFVDGVGGPTDVTLLRDRDVIIPHFVPSVSIERFESRLKEARFTTFC